MTVIHFGSGFTRKTIFYLETGLLTIFFMELANGLLELYDMPGHVFHGLIEHT